MPLELHRILVYLHIEEEVERNETLGAFTFRPCISEDGLREAIVTSLRSQLQTSWRTVPRESQEIPIEIRTLFSSATAAQVASLDPTTRRREDLQQHIAYWEAENENEKLGDTYSTYACFIKVLPHLGEGEAVSGASLADVGLSLGDVSYALHFRRMPTLVLSSSTSASTVREPWCGVSTSIPPRQQLSAEETYLYYAQRRGEEVAASSTAGKKEESLLEALNRFWEPLSERVTVVPRSPLKSGNGSSVSSVLPPDTKLLRAQDGGKGVVLALEWDELVLHPDQWSTATKHRLVQIYHELCEAFLLPEGEEPSSNRRNIIFWSCEGYPVWDIDTWAADDASESLSTPGALLPLPPSAFEALHEKLWHWYPDTVSKKRDRGSSELPPALDAQKGNLADSLLPFHPTLPSEAKVMERFQRFLLLRHLYLFRGAVVVLLGHLSSSALPLAAWLGSCASQVQEGAAATSPASFASLLQSHLNLVHTYLDFPVPSNTFVWRSAPEGAVQWLEKLGIDKNFTGKIVSPSLDWLPPLCVVS